MMKIQKTLDGIAVPILFVDAANRVTQANSKALACFPTIQPGIPISLTSPLGMSLDKLLRATAKTGDETTKLVSDEDEGWEYKATARTLAPDNERDEARFALTFEDRTPVLTARSMRSDFVANVSHEIRSPLTAISGFVESMQDDNDMEISTRILFLGLMEKEVTRMINLVGDLLSLSKVEAKERVALKKTAVPGEVLQQAYETLARRAWERGNQIEFRISDDLPDIPGKHDDLLRVFINLIENAINYSRDNGRITLTMEKVGENNPLGRPAIRVSVKDEGDGIPAAEIPRLTERFYRVDKSRSRDMGGTGLGLAIVKHILVRHRGFLDIKSTPGKGSNFIVYLPVS